MRGMIKRWLRRRLDIRTTNPETSLDDEDRERGTLVRKGRLVSLRTHVPANREAFQRWYADREIAELLRHDLEPLTPDAVSRLFRNVHPAVFGTRHLLRHPRAQDQAPHRHDRAHRPSQRAGKGVSALFRIVIGEKDVWGRGYGTEATRLVAEEAFDSMGLSEIRLEVFNHNQRAIAAYTRVGFEVTGEHVEWVPRRKTELRVIEMRLSRDAFLASGDGDAGDSQRRPRRSTSVRSGSGGGKSARSPARSDRRNARVPTGTSARMRSALEQRRQPEPTDPD